MSWPACHKLVFGRTGNHAEKNFFSIFNSLLNWNYHNDSMVNKAVLMILFMLKLVQNVHHHFRKCWQAILWAT
uniref:Uncharacterized protein n=1 Tax=Arundo donax TaxID=35708 RepID=A0A0A8YNM9_ARUDO